MKRTVQYSEADDMWKYIGGSKRLPIQWSAWLTHTRLQPPTLQELEADIARRQRVLANAALIDARDRAEVEEKSRIRQEDTHLAIEQAAAGWSRQTTPIIEQPRPVPELSGVEPAAHVQPPAFLTPSSPRKSKSKKPFSLPPLDTSTDNTAASSTPAQAEFHSTLQTVTSSPWKSAPSETETWAPKARSRG
ncbi:hypothetical protein CPB83DRAFT_854416 [Crepidotus variabilis]|uniref:NADH dehydrogenase [ubiquinone] 1 alpha subcomplex subunit n=1 Tax=Crepidotus variabilis TaxID=179855 RepID=A0A9P6EFV5_9AGAR|nr:hypothetical protein CPB83DRAFT_854416 [Crepidotus variabilis]